MNHMVCLRCPCSPKKTNKQGEKKQENYCEDQGVPASYLVCLLGTPERSPTTGSGRGAPTSCCCPAPAAVSDRRQEKRRAGELESTARFPPRFPPPLLTNMPTTSPAPRAREDQGAGVRTRSVTGSCCHRSSSQEEEEGEEQEEQEGWVDAGVGLKREV